MNNSSKVAGVLRHVLTGVGVAGFQASDDDLVRLLSAIGALASVLWSIWSKSRPGEVQGTGFGPRLLRVAPVALAGVALVGCAGLKFSEVVTPARVEAVVKWGAYEAAVSADTATRAVMRQALPGLRVLAEAQPLDGAAVAAALQAAGLKYLTTPEGSLAVAAVLSFSDVFHQVSGPITDSAYTRAVVRGAVGGLELALSARGMGQELVRRQLETAAVALR